MHRRILIADPSQEASEQLRNVLQGNGQVEVDTVDDGRAALEALSRNRYRVLLADLGMPHVDALGLLRHIRETALPVNVIVMASGGTIQQAVQAIRAGAYEFLSKPVQTQELQQVVHRALEERPQRADLEPASEDAQPHYLFHHVLSRSPRMCAVFKLIQCVADTHTTVLVEGETGTGKELVARAIHQASRPYRPGEFVAINCAALPETLLESELFGHEKGSFTGAVSQRKGRFEQAHQGTIFLDEISEVSPAMQVKLLRVLQERCFERVGGGTPIEADVRVVAATNRGLAGMVKRGRFREDLYYRLNVVRIELPPLRERQEDIPLLAAHFAARYTRPGESPRGISPAVMEKLLQHSWPGNVRELENALERACVTARGPLLEVEDLPPEVQVPHPHPPRLPVDLTRSLPELLHEATVYLEKEYLRKALKQCQGNVSRCAPLCGLSRRSLSAKISAYQIDKEEFKAQGSGLRGQGSAKKSPRS